MVSYLAVRGGLFMGVVTKWEWLLRRGSFVRRGLFMGVVIIDGIWWAMPF